MKRETVGTRIRTLRLQSGMTQDDLAFEIGASGKPTICRIENNQRLPGERTVSAIAEVFGTTKEYLLNGTGTPPPAPVPPAPTAPAFQTVERFQIRGRPKQRCTMLLYPRTVDKIRELAKAHNISMPELVDQFVEYGLRNLEE